jgi:Bacterial PH domain
MSYVDSNLLPGEQVIFRGRLHGIIFTLPIGLAVIGILSLTVSGVLGISLLGAAAILGFASLVQFISSEFAVTNRRVILKEGFIRRRTIELLLQKVESIDVRQGIFARMCDYGDIIVVGTGATHEPFTLIASPLELRRAVQSAATTEETSEAADSRTCPFCAESIKRAAVVCRYCGRDVPPAPAAARPSASVPASKAAPPSKVVAWRERLIGLIVIGVVVTALILMFRPR